MAEAIQDVSNLGVAKGRPGGYAVIAPAGFNLETFEDMTKTLAEIITANQEVKSLGYITEDGVEWSTDTDTSDITEWGGKIVSRGLSSYAESAAVTFMESREAVLKAVFGDANVTVDGATTTVRHNENFTDPHVFVFDSVVSTTKVKRTIVPLGRIFERDSRTENNSDVAGYAPTISAMPYDGYDGDAYRDLIYDTAYVAPKA